MTLESMEKIEAAQAAVDALSEEDKADLENQQMLTDAYTAYETLLAEKKAEEDAAAAKEIDAVIQALPAEVDEVRGMTFYYSKVWPYYSDTRSYVLPYIGTTKDDTWLRLVYHYTGDDWVFFTNVTVSVDGENYYRTFSYYDVERDNEYGNVWEWIDLQPDDSDVKMLRAIAASEKTIVRFEGDTYWSDLVVTAEDKAAITEILDTYELMN